jgi:hypothetical protein
MTPDLAIAIAAALALGMAAGWLTAMRYGQPPQPPALSPADIEALKRAFKGLFAQFIDNTTTVVGGLQEDMTGMREALERLSQWSGDGVENPAQLARWMSESSEDRKRLRRRVTLLSALVVAGLPMILVIFARVVYVMLWGNT